jgi:hypothetical protein
MSIDTPPRQGDVLPGHVAILEGRDPDGKVHLIQAQPLDRPFLGWFFALNLYEAIRQDVVTREAFAEKYPAAAT